MKRNSEKRFTIKDTMGISLGSLTIIVDNQTGVNYLMTIGSAPNGITPLLDAEGNVTIDKINHGSIETE